jgi:hypothetical protein
MIAYVSIKKDPSEKFLMVFEFVLTLLVNERIDSHKCWSTSVFKFLGRHYLVSLLNGSHCLLSNPSRKQSF